jgi:hypothetical protein
VEAMKKKEPDRKLLPDSFLTILVIWKKQMIMVGQEFSHSKKNHHNYFV